MSVSHPPGYDPMPQPPSKADYDACCGSGCDPCIFDLYDQAMERYRKALEQWRGRHPEVALAEGLHAGDNRPA